MTGQEQPEVHVVPVLAGEDGFVFGAVPGGPLHQLAFGPQVAVEPPAVPLPLHPRAYPTYGDEVARDPALVVTHADGSTITRLGFVEARVEPVRGGAHHEVELADPVTGLVVVLGFRTWDHQALVEQWTEVRNAEPGPITVHEVAAGAPNLHGTDPWLTHHGGGWAAEWTTWTEPLTLGTKVLASRGGVRPHLQVNPFFHVAPAGRATEGEGTVLVGALAWGGDVRFAFERAPLDQVRTIVGANPVGAALRLEPGERHRTPTVVWAWSDAGLGPASRRLQRHVRDEVVRDGRRPRAVVANNWEATFFDFDEPRLVGLVERAAAVGAELFLLDDGWFGVSHPRDDDTQGLGDWDVDRRKLPEGLAPVIAAAEAAGIRFGLWVEPEMVNPRSTLAEEHPDWIVGAPGREPREERNQRVLDLVQPEVADWVVATVDRVLAEHPGTTYVKWDANRDVSEPASPALAPERAGHYPEALARATWTVMDRVAAAHPDVELMLCASGGGRVDLGTLAFFHEVWTSDNTDPVSRVRMQHAASMYLPANVLGAHVTSWGHRPLPFACAVALSARFGLDLDLAALDDEDLAVVRRAVAAAKDLRELVQFGDQHRVVSPLDGGPSAATAFVDAEARSAVLFGYQLDEAADPPALVVPGLAPAATYEVLPIDLTSDEPPELLGRWSGAELAAGRGPAWPLAEPLTAFVWQLVAEGEG